jgi:hypothetical protein
MNKTIMLVFLALSLGACASDPKPNVAPPSTPATSPTGSPVASPSGSPVASPSGSPGATAGKAEAMVGKWPGVEGASLNIAKTGDKYSIEITAKDGTKKFEGTAKGDTIEFKRGDKTETIKAATGDETGVKGLAGKKECVVVTKGSEGFCRK